MVLAALVRGKSHEAAEAVTDRNAIVILRQQVRDCAESVAAARRAVAVASAQNEQELAQQAKLASRIQDLEKRTIIAMEQGKDDLARDAAEIMLVHTSITVTKTIRDAEEADRFFNKLEDAKTEKLLRDINAPDNQQQA